MKGHVRQRTPGSWTLQWYDRASGRYRSQTVRGTKRQADAELARIIHEYETGQLADPTRITLEQYLEKWLSTVKPTLGVRTWARYEEIIRSQIVPGLGARILSRLRPLEIQQWYGQALVSGRLRPRRGEGKGLSAQTVLHFHRLLHKTLADAVKWGLLTRNPCDAVDPPQVQQIERPVFTRDQLKALWREIRHSRYRLAIILAATTGLRRGEVFGLRWEDVDLNNAVLVVRRSLCVVNSELTLKEPKTKRSRPVDLPQFAVKALRKEAARQGRLRMIFGAEDYQDNGLVICTPEGCPINPDHLSWYFRVCADRAGCEGLSLHSLRHTYASVLLHQGVPLTVVQALLGHSTFALTMNVYGHMLKGAGRQGAQAVEKWLGED